MHVILKHHPLHQHIHFSPLSHTSNLTASLQGKVGSVDQFSGPAAFGFNCCSLTVYFHIPHERYPSIRHILLCLTFFFWLQSA